jgi:hypothetical protein
MSSRAEKLRTVLPAMKLDILFRHNDIMKVLGDIANNFKMRSGDTIQVHPKIMEVLVKSVETNMGLLIVTGEIKEKRISWNEIALNLSDFLKNDFTLKSGWLFSEYVINDREFCRKYMNLVFLTEDNMQSEYSLTTKCMIREKDQYLEISRFNYSKVFGK